MARYTESMSDSDMPERDSEFLSVAAHQLRTPLAAVKWTLSMLKANEFASEAERDEFIEKATGSIDRMIMLVNDLLEVAHLESGIPATFSSVDIGDVLANVTSDLKSQIDAKQQTLSLTVSPDVVVKGDSTTLHALLQNL